MAPETFQVLESIAQVPVWAPLGTLVKVPTLVTVRSLLTVVVAEDEPIVMVLATEPVPILTVLALFPVPRFTVPVEVESKVNAPVKRELMVKGMLVSEPAEAIVGPEPEAAGVILI